MIEQIDDNLLLADFGVSIATDAISGIGILDANSELILQGQVVSVDYSVTCRTELFGGLQYGQLLSVAGETFKVLHEPMRFADGSFCVVPLERSVEPFAGVFSNDVFELGVFV